ncbi:hypothetical protein JYP51_17265 [Ponticoccus gilvus]|nr:hypothetical protein [Enemella evansiae]
MSIGSMIRRAVGSYSAAKTGHHRRRPVRSRRSAESQVASGLFRMFRRKI